MSFVENLIKTSTERNVDFNERKKECLNEIMRSLTLKYHGMMKDALSKAADMGRRDKYINFNRSDFITDFPSLRDAYKVAHVWMKEMVNPDSVYLPENNDGEKEHFNGLRYEVWNNKVGGKNDMFTIHFKW